MAELQKNYASPIAFRQFNLKNRSGGDPASDALRAQLLLNQNMETPPDLVVAFGPPATTFWFKYKGPGFLNTPFIGVGSDFTLPRENFRPGNAAIAVKYSFSNTLEDLLGLFPETSHILMVFGASDHEQRLASLAKLQLEEYAHTIDFEYTNKMNLPDLQNRLTGLSQDSAVFFCFLDSDVNGVLLDYYSGLEIVRAASSVPVFGAFDDQIGHGIVGGRLVQLERSGLAIAEAALEVLHEPPADIAWKTIELSSPVYDWRELEAWGIDSDRLPQGSEIRFKPASLWEQYAAWFLLGTLVFAVQTFFITYLLLERDRRRRAERVSANLSKRLISAHEDERRHLAREIHDDLSHRLACLALDAGFIAKNPGSDVANELVQTIHPELVSLSKDVHDLSYRLHPSLIEDFGIVAALQSQCEQLRRQTDLNILETYSEVPGQIQPDTALNIYRIAQESMFNAVRHARANVIELSLERDGTSLLLHVFDDGAGFDVEHENSRRGLGLSSMHERAQSLGSALTIRSQSGKGTVVSVTVPINGSPA